ncbi:MAG: polyprenyl synthetase family protein, partial [Phyllobacteriaceae bacterium]|nr:polyprenyl synthetase family protein [Phyllobacteriaceae bacterium]
ADASVRSALVVEMARASGEAGMVGGQMKDIEAESGGFASYDAIAAMQGMKTGALFRFACEAGAIMAQADRAPLRQYAEHIGLAFQIADDILDIEADAATLGKATGKDKARGKATFVDFLGLDGAKTEAARLTDAAIAVLTPYGAKADLLKDTARYIVARKK